MLPAQQLVQQHAERIDVGRRRDRTAGHLLRRGVLRRQRRAGLPRQPRHAVVFDQLGDAEVEQLDLSVGGHEDVRGLEVAMHDQVGMRVGHGRQHVEEQANALLDAQARFVAVGVEVPALDELEHQVGLARVGHAGVDQPGDVRMGEPREDGAFAPEALFTAAADQRGVQQLDRDLALEAAVAARGQPHAAHAAVADRRFQRVGADRDAGQRRFDRLDLRAPRRETPRRSAGDVRPASPRRRWRSRDRSARIASRQASRSCGGRSRTRSR